VRHHKVQWSLEKEGQILILSTLYLDGDFLNEIFEDEKGKLPLDLYPEETERYFKEIHKQVTSLETAGKVVGIVAATASTLFTLWGNFKDWDVAATFDHNLGLFQPGFTTFMAVLTVVSWLARNLVPRLLMKAAGKLYKV